MRGGFLPPALLCAALAFALAFAPRRALLPAAVLLVSVALAVSRASLPVQWQEWIFASCWVSVGLTSAAVHLPRIGLYLALILAANAGVWAGATVAVAGAPADLLRAVPVALLALPGQWLVAHRGGLAIKVVASWLIAVAVLAGALATVPTPGYKQDHME